jgi:homoprotocatechuate degradation regulator HpaR
MTNRSRAQRVQVAAGTSASDLPMRDFAHSLPMALLRAREAVMSRFRPMLRAHNLTEQQWRVLRAVFEVEAIEVTALAELCFILMPSLSRILRSLEERGLIERRPVPRDQRRAVIRMTAAGRRLVTGIAPHSESRYDDITQAIGKRKLDELYRLLAEMTAALRSDPRGGEPPVL